MKKRSLTILLFVSQFASSQNPFTKFTNKAGVQWAAYSTDTLHFSQPNLSLLLRERFNNGNIKVAFIDDNLNFKKRNYSNKEAVLQRIAPHRMSEIIEDNGNKYSTILSAENPLFSSEYFDEQTNDLIEAQEILYIQSGKLQSYIPWLSLKQTVTTSWGEKLGITKTFSTGFHHKRKINKRISHQSIFLGSRFHTLPTNTATIEKSMIKQIYGRNILETLWQSFPGKNYNFINPENNLPLLFSEIDKTLLDSSVMSIPVYDENGDIKSKQNLTLKGEPLDLYNIDSIQLFQHWYYSKKKNILFSKIESLTLYAKKWKQGLQDAVSSPVLKIVQR